MSESRFDVWSRYKNDEVDTPTSIKTDVITLTFKREPSDNRPNPPHAIQYPPFPLPTLTAQTLKLKVGRVLSRSHKTPNQIRSDEELTAKDYHEKRSATFHESKATQAPRKNFTDTVPISKHSKPPAAQ